MRSWKRDPAGELEKVVGVRRKTGKSVVTSKSQEEKIMFEKRSGQLYQVLLRVEVMRAET